MTPLTVAELTEWTPAVPKTDEQNAQVVVDAVNGFLGRLGLVPAEGQDDTDPSPDETKLGALMLAARTYRRRNSPNGIETVSGETVAYVARYDPEISRYLRLSVPRVG